MIYSHRFPRLRQSAQAVVLSLACFLGTATLVGAEISRFVGDYAGSALVEQANGAAFSRDMSVSITTTREGFSVRWSSTTYRDDGRTKEKSYVIDFVPSDRDDVFAAAMKRNVFGHAVQLDPMKGEPYVWSRINGDTLTVYSLFVSADGGYELQQFDRTLAEGGLQLDFKRTDNGVPKRSVSTFLKRQ
ncbi:MAG: hypothetical protein AB8B51_15745 [Sedimentitalea sp.]